MENLKSLIMKLFKIFRCVCLILVVIIAILFGSAMVSLTCLEVELPHVKLPNGITLTVNRDRRVQFTLRDKAGNKIVDSDVREIAWNDNYIMGYRKGIDICDNSDRRHDPVDVYFIYKVGAQKAIENIGYTKQQYYALLKESGFDEKDKTKYKRFHDLTDNAEFTTPWYKSVAYHATTYIFIALSFSAMMIRAGVYYLSQGLLECYGFMVKLFTFR